MNVNHIDFSNLSSAEKILMAQQLLDSSFDEGFTPEQMREIEARMQAADNGTMKRIPWETVRAQLGLNKQ